jgi:hypothetical protein
MKEYLVTFKSVSYSSWIIKADSLEEAKNKSNEIDEHGDFVDEITEEYDLIDVVLNNDDEIYNNAKI